MFLSALHDTNHSSQNRRRDVCIRLPNTEAAVVKYRSSCLDSTFETTMTWVTFADLHMGAVVHGAGWGGVDSLPQNRTQAQIWTGNKNLNFLLDLRSSRGTVRFQGNWMLEGVSDCCTSYSSQQAGRELKEITNITVTGHKWPGFWFKINILVIVANIHC